MIRIAIVDPQPAVRAGLAMLLRTEPGLVPVGAAVDADDGLALAEHHLADGDGIALCRRLKMLARPPRVVLYTADPAPELGLLARVASADGVVDKRAEPEQLFEAIRAVSRGGSALPPLDAREMDAAAHLIEPEDLALLAMLADGTAAGEVADTLHLDRVRVARRIERMLGRLRSGTHAAA